MIKIRNIPRISLKILGAKLGKRIPLKVTQYVTYRCNYKCAFCGRRLSKSDELNTDQIKKCMSDFKKMGTEFWGFNGGEPLLREDIGELINYAKALGFKCSLSSNGYLIPQKIDQINKIDLVLISLDGPEKVHDKIRGQGAYNDVIKALEVLKQNKIKTLVVTVINKDNLNYLDQQLNIVKKYGFDWELQPIAVHREDVEKNAKVFFPDKAQLAKTVDWLLKQKKEGQPISNSVGYLEQMKWSAYAESAPDCWAGRIVCVISPDGHILPCAEVLAESKLYKSFLEVGVRKAFNSLPDMSKCRACRLSCYMEYNVALNSFTKTGLKSTLNILNRRHFWQ